jgi:hypothetical protein
VGQLDNQAVSEDIANTDDQASGLLSGEDPRVGRPRITAVKVAARGEQFRIVQVHGTLFVCSRQSGSC